MKALTCEAVWRQLDADHDEELSTTDQIAVSSHLEWCDQCASRFAELRTLRKVLRVSMAGRAAVWGAEEVSFPAAVISRMKAEEAGSFGVWMRGIFEDRHFVYAGLSTVAAALVSVAVMLGMVRFATNERRDSMAAMVKALGSPGSNQNPVSLNPRMRMPRPLDDGFSSVPAFEDGDTVFMLSGVVTREGRVECPTLLNSNGGQWVAAGGSEADLLGVVSRIRFEPASMAGLPVAMHMVWIVAHTTVRATKDPIDLSAMPAGKKRSA